MGSVWKAEDPLLGRSVALKFLPDVLSDHQESRQRFLREARAASGLDHPGIATVYDAGESDGLVYIAMACIDGETLRDRIARGPMPVSDAIEVARQTTEALAYAHERGVVHRDVTSRNIMITGGGRVIVVDFGLALPEGETRLTMPGTMMGTVAYMAPEVARGYPSDDRSDVYSLGVVLYEMLTTRLPFEGDQPGAVLYAIVNADPAPPRTFRPDLPYTIEEVVMEALAKDPEDRHQSALEFADALAAVAGDTSIARLDALAETTLTLQAGPHAAQLPKPRTPRAQPRTPSAQAESSRRSPTRKRFFVPPKHVVLGVLAASAVAAALWARNEFWSERTYASVAVLPIENVSDDVSEGDFLAAGISEALITKLTQVGKLRVTPWMTAQRYAGTDRALTDISKELNVDALVVGTFRKSGSRMRGTMSLVDGKSGLQIWADEFEQPYEEIFEMQRAIALSAARRLAGHLRGEEEAAITKPVASSVEAYEHYLRGAAALQVGDEESDNVALAFFEKAVQIDPKLAEAYVGIGAVHANRFFYGRPGGSAGHGVARASYERALEINPNLGIARSGLIGVYMEEGDTEAVLRQGKAGAESLSHELDALSVSAFAYVLGGLPGKAVPLLNRVLQLDPESPRAMAYLVIALAWSGDHREAVGIGERFISKFGDESEVLLWMAVSSHCLRDFAAADALYRRILASPIERTAYTAFFAGNLYQQMGDIERARMIWRNEAEIVEGKLLADPDNVRMLVDRACFHVCLGEAEKSDAVEEALWAKVEATGMFPGDASYLCAAFLARGQFAKAAETQARLRGRGYFEPSVLNATLAAGIVDDRHPEVEAFMARERAEDARLRAVY